MLFEIVISSIVKSSILLGLVILYVQHAQDMTAAVKHNKLAAALVAMLLVPLLELSPKLGLQLLPENTATLPNTNTTWADLPPAPLVFASCVYALGVLLGFFRIYYDYRALNRQLQKASTCNVNTLPSQIAQLTKESTRRITFYYLDTLSSPITVGVREPKVVLPPHFLEQPKHTVSVALQHELAHIRRRDWLVQLLTRILVALFWFNPLVHYCAKHILNQAEIAADDELVLAGEDAPEYANVLLNYAQRNRPSNTSASDNKTVKSHQAVGLWTAMLGPGLAGRVHALTRRTPRRYYDGFGLAENLAVFVILLLPFTVLTAVPSQQPRPVFNAQKPVELNPSPIDTIIACGSPAFTLDEPDHPPHSALPHPPHTVLAKWAPDAKRLLPIMRFAINAPTPALEPLNIASLTPQVSRLGFMPIVNVMPKYPNKAIRRNIEGFVDISFDIQRDGTVSNAQIIRSEPRRIFDRAALKAIQQSRFAVHQLNGSSVQVRDVENRYVFRLSDPGKNRGPQRKEKRAPEIQATDVLIAQGVHHDYL